MNQLVQKYSLTILLNIVFAALLALGTVQKKQKELVVTSNSRTIHLTGTPIKNRGDLYRYPLICFNNTQCIDFTSLQRIDPDGRDNIETEEECAMDPMSTWKESDDQPLEQAPHLYHLTYSIPINVPISRVVSRN